VSTSKVREVSRRLETLSRNAEGISSKFSAHLALHAAAVLEGDREQMSEHRRSLHVILDRLLDNGEQIQKCNDELAELLRL
jgi:hypothetical protein